jgi:mRNA interferase MazF
MYKKDFDKWNDLKKFINIEKRRSYKEREVWWCRLGVNVGYEQDGTGDFYDRPVLVLKRFNKTVCLVVPLTTSRKINYYLVSIGKINGREAKGIISQIRLVDSCRLVNRISVIELKYFNKIRKAIRDLI